MPCVGYYGINLPFVYTSIYKQGTAMHFFVLCLSKGNYMQPCVQVTNYLCCLMQPLQRQTTLYSLFQHYFDIEQTV